MRIECSSARRLELIEPLAQGERRVEALARALSLPVAHTSRPLQVLRAARSVETRRRGTFVHYRLSDPDVFELARTIRVLAEHHLAELDRIVRADLRARDSLEPIGREVLLERLRSGDAIVVDVRPAEEYRAGHIPGALTIPVGEIEARLGPARRDLLGGARMISDRSSSTPRRSRVRSAVAA